MLKLKVILCHLFTNKNIHHLFLLCGNKTFYLQLDISNFQQKIFKFS